ncbi:MAG: CDP-alcohol phosphatidyltransferase family protein [Acutalibacteraceae bacterium]
MANFVTALRIIFSVALLFCPAFSPAFYMLYLSAGFTDMVDGTIARKTNTVSDLGSRLDTVADFIFTVASLVKLIPVLDIPTWIYIWLGIIAIKKIINIVSGFIVQKRLVAVHSVMNKTTGLFLFILPLTVSIIDLKYSGAFVCALATFAAIQEGHYIRINKNCNSE